MKNPFLPVILGFMFFVASAQEERFLSGVVYEDIHVLENVSVVNLTKDITTISNREGRYKISVATNDIIRFSFVGMRSIEIRVEDVTRVLNIEMFPEVTELNEVVVQKKRRLTQEELRANYDINEGIIFTGFGFLDAEKTIGDIQVMNSNEFKKNGACLLDVLRLNFTGLAVQGSCAKPGPIFIRSILGSTIIEVDGLIRDPHIIPIENIKRIGIFAGTALARRYGAGVGGVIVINTFSGTAFSDKIVDRARLRDNFIKEPNIAEQYIQENQRRNQNKKTISGTVTDGKAPIANVNVSIENSNISTVTNEKGRYKIKANLGDKIKFSFIGLKTVTIKIEDVTRILNPVMYPDVTELDEVVVEASKRRSQKDLEEDYNLRKNIIKTAFGYLDGDRAPGNIRFMDEEDIAPINLCILDVLRAQFAMVKVTGNCQRGGSVFMRGSGSIGNASAAIFDVDGQIFTDVPIWIDANNIKRIALLNGLATTNAYGTIGNGGVVVINTIVASSPNKGLVDQVRLKNNFLSGRILTESDVQRNQPSYLKELESAISYSDAKKVFESYDSFYGSSPYFYLDAYIHFFDKWNQQDYADSIIKDNYGLFQNNAVLLKALAYQYEGQQRFKKANKTYREIFLLRPNYAQSYMDMANSYRDINELRSAASLYARYEYLLETNFMERDTIGFGPVMEREFNNLLTLNKNAVLESTKANTLYIAKEDFKGTRLVFEWNDSEAEFDLQFVNPGNQYYTWKHNLVENAERIYGEKDYGYNVTEYLLDGSLPGTWSVNVNYLGNKSLTPTYLKATVYYDYGSKSQRKEIRVFKLSLKNVNQELYKIQSKAKIATN